MAERRGFLLRDGAGLFESAALLFLGLPVVEVGDFHDGSEYDLADCTIRLPGCELLPLHHAGIGRRHFTKCLSIGQHWQCGTANMVLIESSSLEMVRERVWRSAQRTVESRFHKLTFQAMSTVCRVHFQSPDSRLANEFQDFVLDWVAGFEAKYSRFLPDSLISRINAAAGQHWVEIDPETEALFNLCQELLFFTRGVFDPTALPLMRLWNWKAKNPVVPSPEQVKEALELVGWRKVQRRPGGIFLPEPGMMIDLGGIGKEYAVDRVLTMGLERNIANILVDFGEDVRVHGESPQKGRVVCWIGGSTGARQMLDCCGDQ